MTKHLKYLVRMNDNLGRVTWQTQTLLFCTVFWLITLACSIPFTLEGIRTITLNQVLEDFGVFTLFLSLWCGVYAHFRRNITLPWLVLLLLLSLWQEEVNLLNKIYQTVNIWIGRDFDSAERQRGDVTVLMLVAVSLLARFLCQGFKSIFRIHITSFLIFFTLFQLWLHAVFPYTMQQAIIEPYLEYQKEFTSTYPGRFDYQCAQGKWECHSWIGGNVPELIAKNAELMAVIESHEGVTQNTMGFVATKANDVESVFRGIDAGSKYIVTYMKNHDLNRVVFSYDFTQKAAELVTSPLLIFSTAFSMVWFFGGIGLVLMHQARFSRK